MGGHMEEHEAAPLLPKATPLPPVMQARAAAYKQQAAAVRRGGGADFVVWRPFLSQSHVGLEERRTQ